MQGHLGAFFTEVHPAFSGLPTGRHEAACASGSIALLAASAEIEAGRYDLQAVVGIEQMKTVSAADRAAPTWARPPGTSRRRKASSSRSRSSSAEARRRVRQALRAEGRAPRRDQPAQLRERQAQPERPDAHLVHEQGARALPHRRQPGGGRAHPHRGLLPGDRRRGLRLPGLARVRGEVRARAWARSSRTSRASRAGATTRRGCASTTRSPRAPGASTCCPTCAAPSPAPWKRAGIADVNGIDGIETHDCFTTSEYMAIDHFGITEPGESWKAVEEGWLEIDGKHPINPSGGLIGAGHPVGATGTPAARRAPPGHRGQAATTRSRAPRTSRP